jgi:predicted PurR-regulated permease PerM
MIERNRWLRGLIVLLVLIAALHLGGLLWELGQRFFDIIVMFFLAWLLAFVLSPLTQTIERWLGVPRALAAAAVYLVLFVGLLTGLVLLLPALVVQLVEIGRLLPSYAERVPTVLTEIQADLNARSVDVDITALYRPQDLSASLVGVGSTAVQNTVTILTGVLNVAFTIVLVLVLSFYMVVDGDLIETALLSFVPDSRRREVDFFLDSVNRSFGGFLRGTLIQAVVYALGTALVMLVGGLDFVLVASLFAGVVMIIPIFGPFLAIVPPVAIALISAPVQTVLIVVGGLLLLQQLTFNVLAPKVMSDSLGMHPLMIFAALLVGGRVAGFAGAIFGVPVAAVLWAMFRQAVGQTNFGRLAKERHDAAEHERRRAAAERARAIAAGELRPSGLARLRPWLARLTGAEPAARARPPAESRR